MQALYRAEVVGNGLADVQRELQEESSLPEEVRDYAVRLFDLVSGHGEEIDETLRRALTRWDLKRLAVIDRCVLRIGVAELLFEPDVPTRVALDEAIEMAKEFGSGESGRFVNGVLDRVARDRCGEGTA
jgi:transcription antitermination factor NusB